jgi:hypothetical protein
MGPASVKQFASIANGPVQRSWNAVVVQMEELLVAPQARGPPGFGAHSMGPVTLLSRGSFGVKQRPSSRELPKMNPLTASEHAQSSAPRVARHSTWIDDVLVNASRLAFCAT